MMSELFARMMLGTALTCLLCAALAWKGPESLRFEFKGMTIVLAFTVIICAVMFALVTVR